MKNNIHKIFDALLTMILLIVGMILSIFVLWNILTLIDIIYLYFYKYEQFLIWYHKWK